MADALVMLFDDPADQAVRELWLRLEEAGVPSARRPPLGRLPPHLTLAVAGSIPQKTREALRAELRLLTIPSLWFATLSTFAATQHKHVLMLTAVVDNELLAVHSAAHDVLAGRVKQPTGLYLPGSWVPHCTLANGVEHDQLITGFAALHPLDSIRASVRQLAVIDTRTIEVDVLMSR